jgi:hypothetical protein
MIDNIGAAMEALVYGAEKVSTTKHSRCQMRLDTAQNAVTTWPDDDCQKAIGLLDHEIPQVTPVQCKLFDKLFQRHACQLLQNVRTRPTRP